MPDSLIIDDEFKNIIPPLTTEEFNGLKKSIIEEGCRDPLVVWNDIILDGHNRFVICQKHGLIFKTVRKNLDSRDAAKVWIIKNQFGRRNLSTYDRGILILMIEEILAKPAKDRMLSGAKAHPDPNLGQGRVNDSLAKSANMSKGTLHKIKAIRDKADDKIKKQLEQKEISVDKAYKQLKNNECKKEREQLAEEGKKIQITDDFIDLRLGDFKEQLKDIPDNSIDLILTDPPYPKEYLECWYDLSEIANRVLKPGGFCVTYSGQMHLPEVIKRLGENLEYYWTFCLYHEGKTQIVNGVNLICRWKPILIYQKKPKHKLDITTQDYIVNSFREKTGHDWQQGEDGIKKLLEIFSKPGDTILDPFAGTGSVLYCSRELKRKSIGCEIEEKTYNIAKKRIQNVGKKEGAYNAFTTFKY